MLRCFFKRILFFTANLLHYDDEKFNSKLVNFFYKMTGMKIGENTYISRGFDAINPNNIILEDCVDLGQNNSIQAFAPIKICKYVHTARDVSMISGSHNTIDFGSPDKDQSITIGSGCWIGTRVTILGGVKIGKGCVIGACSLVNKDIPDFSVAVGNPCKVIKKRVITKNMIIHPSRNYTIDEIL